MPRVSGIDLPAEKRTDIALTYIYGIGRSNVRKILTEANVAPSKRAKDLNTDEISRLQRIIDRINTEGELRKQIRENIERLKRVGTYRGTRHIVGLPARGQRTRVNARTKRGKRKTIGALSKKEAQKLEVTNKPEGPAK